MDNDARQQLIAANLERSRRDVERRAKAEEVRRLRETHRVRADIRHALSLAETGLMGPGFSLAMWAGYDEWMGQTTQEQRDEKGPKALAQLDEAIAAFLVVRDRLAAELGHDVPELGTDYLPGGRFEHEAARRFSVDVLREKHTYFVLSDALREWASEQRSDAQFERSDDPDDTTAAQRDEWADHAEQLLDRIETALSGPGTTREGQPE